MFPHADNVSYDGLEPRDELPRAVRKRDGIAQPSRMIVRQGRTAVAFVVIESERRERRRRAELCERGRCERSFTIDARAHAYGTERLSRVSALR